MDNVLCKPVADVVNTLVSKGPVKAGEPTTTGCAVTASSRDRWAFTHHPSRIMFNQAILSPTKVGGARAGIGGEPNVRIVG